MRKDLWHSVRLLVFCMSTMALSACASSPSSKVYEHVDVRPIMHTRVTSNPETLTAGATPLQRRFIRAGDVDRYYLDPASGAGRSIETTGLSAKVIRFYHADGKLVATTKFFGSRSAWGHGSLSLDEAVAYLEVGQLGNLDSAGYSIRLVGGR